MEPPLRTASGAVVLPLPWTIAPPLAPSVVLPEIRLTAKDELHLTLLSSTEAESLDATTDAPDAWQELLVDSPIEPASVSLTGAWWLLRADKPDGPAWSIVAMARAARRSTGFARGSRWRPGARSPPMRRRT